MAELNAAPGQKESSDIFAALEELAQSTSEFSAGSVFSDEPKKADADNGAAVEPDPLAEPEGDEQPSQELHTEESSKVELSAAEVLEIATETEPEPETETEPDLDTEQGQLSEPELDEIPSISVSALNAPAIGDETEPKSAVEIGVREIKRETGQDVVDEDALFQEFSDIFNEGETPSAETAQKLDDGPSILDDDEIFANGLIDKEFLKTLEKARLRNLKNQEYGVEAEFTVPYADELEPEPMEGHLRSSNALSLSVIEASVAAMKASFADQLPQSALEQVADGAYENDETTEQLPDELGEAVEHVAESSELLPISPVAALASAEDEDFSGKLDCGKASLDASAGLNGSSVLEEGVDIDEDSSIGRSASWLEGPHSDDREAYASLRDLLDVMALPDGVVQPQERALAADTLLRKLDRMPVSSKAELAERVALMETPPTAIVSRLVNDESIEVAGPLIENGAFVSDQDLKAIIDSDDIAKCRMIARRRHVSPALARELIDHGDPAVLLALVRNPEPSLSAELLAELTVLANTQPALQAPLATRKDMTPQIAFELFWCLPAELRRFVFSRFLTDSKTLERVLRIAVDSDQAKADEDKWDAGSFPEEEAVLEIVSLAEQKMKVNAVKQIADLAHVSERNADRILSDEGGEPMVVALKAMGLTRASFDETIERLKGAPAAGMSEDRDIEELRALFDTLSYNKTRVVLTYWDWLTENPEKKKKKKKQDQVEAD
ncbi:MAG: DUF2336 domain-containing protein [Hyphomicrobiales bacterium]